MEAKAIADEVEEEVIIKEKETKEAVETQTTETNVLYSAITIRIWGTMLLNAKILSENVNRRQI